MVYIIKLDTMNDVVAPAAGKTHAQLLDLARKRTGENIYFVACSAGVSHWTNVAAVAGYQAFSVYNLFNTWTNRDTPTAGPLPANYAQLTANYRAEWLYFIDRMISFGMEVIIPMTAGWDNRPWSSTPLAETLTVNPTPAEIEKHWREALAVGESTPVVQGYVIDAWNEWGEGSYIEPCKEHGQQRLDINYKVFKT